MDPAGHTQAFARDLALAESATAAQSWPEAAEGWARVTTANPVVSYYWTRLGDARFECGDLAGAITAFEQADELRDGLHGEIRLKMARAYARLGDRDSAVQQLTKAVERGLRSLAEVREDEAFRDLHDDAAFRELAGLTDVDAMSRDEGWRFDLRFLWRELKRLAYAPFRFASEATFLERIAEIDRRIPELTDLQIVVEIEKLLALLGDGHAGIHQTPEVDENRRALPVQFYAFEEGLFITAAGAAYRDLLGAEVLRIGERTIPELWAALTPLICRDNEQWLKSSIPHRLRETPVLHAMGLTPDPDRAALTIRDLSGTERVVQVESDTSHHRSMLQRHFFTPESWIRLPETLEPPVPLYERNRGLSFWFEPLPDERMVYAQINAIRDLPQQTLPAFGDQLVDLAEEPGYDRLVIDLRWNPGGNTLLEMPLLHRLIGSKKLNVRGRLFVIIGRATFSAAQNFTTLLERHTNAIFAGEPTGSSPTFVGETIEFQLPYSRCSANVSDLLWQSGWPTDERPWVAPQFFTPPTFAAYRANRDSALDAIRALGLHLPSAVGSPYAAE
jgi:tetratricopeptide (TPR) repeat protein